MSSRQPDLIIGPRHDPQTIRWHLVIWRGFQLSLHKWLRSDSDRAPHDHKADNISVILSPQGYYETVRELRTSVFTPIASEGWKEQDAYHWYRDRTYYRWPLVPYFRKAETPHRVTLIGSSPVWTLWLRWPARRRWGYWCIIKGWVDADDYNKQADYYAAGVSEVGNGCG